MTDNEMKPYTVSLCISSDWCRGYNEAVKKANEIINRQKAEAVKEFAERLKEKVGGSFMANHSWVGEIIDNLVKKMAGDADG